MKKVILLIIFLVNFISITKGQSKLQDLAQQYVNEKEYEKALVVYEQLLKEDPEIEKFFPAYYQLLLQQKKTNEAEIFLKKLIKTNQKSLVYEIELCALHEQLNGKEKTEKEWIKVYDKAIQTQQIERGLSIMNDKGLYNHSEALIQRYRKKEKNDKAYATQLADIYFYLNQSELGIKEYVNIIEQNPSLEEEYKNKLQNVLLAPEQMDFLETLLIEKIQEAPTNAIYTDLLTWLYIQEKAFQKAFVQVKAFEKRNAVYQGSKLLDLGIMVYEHQAYTDAQEIFEYIILTYKNTSNRYVAQRYLIQTKEAIISKTYPVQENEIRNLIQQYLEIVNNSNNMLNNSEALINAALLYTFYLNKPDSSILLLTSIINNSYDLRTKNNAKLYLGDVYLFNNEPWEASLIYSQVEKEMKEDVLGHEAKLRNAKLYFYKGEFELAQEQLDVLKLATSREISNDAMQLSLLIQDNIGLDSTTTAMEAYARIDLLVYKHQYQLALDSCVQFQKNFPQHSLSDEVYWLNYKIYLFMNKPDLANQQLQYIYQNFKTDIWGDDALFYSAELNQTSLNNKAKAIELYSNLLVEYPGSTYAIEARKRIRILRGN